MNSNYELRMPGVVYHGENALESLVSIVQGKYNRAVIFTDKGIEKAGILEEPIRYLTQGGVSLEILNELPSEPTCDQAQKIIDRFITMKADIIIAIGGGSVMDIAKLASVTGNGALKVRDLLKSPHLCKKTIKTIMIPTTAGTGSEATPNCIVAIPEKELKVGIVHTDMIADFVLLDGRMIRNLPKKIAASTGVDALAHAIECYTSNKANSFSDLFALEALKLIFSNIEKACEDVNAIKEKGNMLLASFYAGVAISASGTTAVHALSYPLGGKYHIPHGIANAIMLLPVLKYNKPYCLEEFATVYDFVHSPEVQLLSKDEKAEKLLKRLEEILHKLSIETSLRSYGIKESDLDTLVQAGMEVERLLMNNKREVTREAARELYLQVI
ncbi:iron-containing alcohol dehydrogenase [Lachnoclostridium phytofermentans]|uniref:iron-containing alcohol dehydrogenase n=1 Tax=Lachnoclostridium phytofermentans TaxID=66219 RepID=UPI00049853BF|nr:iron-containing alcohol dehydrogenase [Lachnoclostridium phytofermentans]